MTQWLRVPVALPMDFNYLLSIHVGQLTSRCRGSNVLLEGVCTFMAYTQLLICIHQ